jgi:NAD-dependent dihydropyrimidine dehydrogenase PreA subunit
MLRDIVIIDEDLCDGCGVCVPACHEGALRIIDGKARLMADNLCDGLGACLGHCPRGAIRVEKRDAEAFDEVAVAAAQHGAPAHARNGGLPTVTAPHGGDRTAAHSAATGDLPCGCPGTHLKQFARPAHAAAGPAAGPALSELSHWPVQLRLLPPTAPVLRGARLLIAADCVPVAYAGFHQELLRGRAVVIACPKLDDPHGYVEKLTQIVAANQPESVTVAHMEVPCCTGILRMVWEACQDAGYAGPVESIVIGTDGVVRERRSLQ